MTNKVKCLVIKCSSFTQWNIFLPILESGRIFCVIVVKISLQFKAQETYRQINLAADSKMIIPEQYIHEF